ncbi:BtrH N-terminal domain-containing protein [Homoserinimonas sp. A447]
MTEHNSLKKLVRERMARTGESYTTAHRQVTSRQADRTLAGLTPGYPAFGADAHGPSGLARHLLAQAGIDISEAMACGLGGGIGFLYAIFEYKQVPHPMLTVVAQHHPQPWLEAVTEHLGLTLSMATSSKPAPALAKLDAALESGRAAQLTVGRGLLPWHSARPEEAADPYAIVVAGKHGNEYLVDDRSAEPHRLDADTLADAWAAHRKGRFALATIEPAPVDAALIDRGAGIRSAVATTHAHLTGPVLGNSFDVNLGLSGIRKFADELADTRTKAGWAKRFADPSALAVGSRRLAECLTWAHTAAGATRLLYAEFLAEAEGVSGLKLAAASQTAAASGARWAELADVAGATTEDDDPAETIAAYAELVADILPLEEKLAAQLAAALETQSRASVDRPE